MPNPKVVGLWVDLLVLAARVVDALRVPVADLAEVAVADLAAEVAASGRAAVCLAAGALPYTILTAWKRKS